MVVAPLGVEEVAPDHLSPSEITLGNAKAKARSIAPQFPNTIVIGVDTEVFFENRVLGKPADMDDAFAMLSRLNGRVHEVHSGVCLIHGEKETGFNEITRVHFRQQTDDALRAYLARINPLDKAGAYAAQEDHGEMILRFEGSFSNIIGLPMEALARELGRFAAPTEA